MDRMKYSLKQKDHKTQSFSPKIGWELWGVKLSVAYSYSRQALIIRNQLSKYKLESNDNNLLFYLSFS